MTCLVSNLALMPCVTARLEMKCLLISKFLYLWVPQAGTQTWFVIFYFNSDGCNPNAICEML